MSTPASTPASAVADQLHAVRASWGWFAVLGIAFIVLGFVAIAHVLSASVVTALYVGALILVGGVVQVIHAFRMKGWGRFAFWLLAGVFYIIAGGLMMSQPLLTLAVLTLFVGVALAVDGIFRIVAGFGARPSSSWFYLVLSGLVSLLLGALIISRWPENSLYILGLFLGIDLIVNGVGTLLFGLGLKKA